MVAQQPANPPRTTVTGEVPSAPRAPSAPLSGRALVLARGVWLGVAALTVGLYMASTGIWLGQVRGSCPPGVCVHGQVPRAVARSLAALPLSVRFYGWYHLGLSVLFAGGFAGIAALLLWRRSHDPLALYISLALLLFGALSPFSSGLLDRLGTASPAWRLPVELLQFLGVAAFGILGYVFPDGRFAPRWTRLAAAAVALWFLPAYLWPDSPFSFGTWPGPAFFGGFACFFGSVGVAQVYRYRRVSTPIQRQQTKWVVFAIVAAGVGYFAGALVIHLFRAAGPLGTLAPTLTAPRAVLADLAGGALIYVSLLLIPLCIGIAVLRYHLFDIDVIIRQTLVYGLLTGMLALVYFGSIVAAQAVVQAAGGHQQPLPPVVVVVSTLLIAALFQPLRLRIQNAIDRRFYRRKYDAAKTLEAFTVWLRTETNLEDLHTHVLAVVEETMQPEHVSLWLRTPVK